MKDLLVLRLSALGDVIHTLPAVTLLRDALPGRSVAWAVEEPYRELVEIVGRVRAIPLRMKRWGRAPLASRPAIATAFRDLRGHAVSADMQGLIKSAALGRLSGAPVRYGFGRGSIREKAASLFINRGIEVDTSRHVIEQNCELAAAIARAEGALTAGDAVPRPDFSPFAADPEGKLAALAGAVVLLPGAGRPDKIWPVERFRRLAAEIGREALALWGPGEKEMAEAIGARLAPPTTLRELAWVLRHATLVIGGDTGPLHLAAALGTKTVGLYGPTDPRRNGPWGQLDRCLDRFRATKLMESISVEDVMETLEAVGAE